MSKPTASPRLPDSPGAWIACFRHRVQCNRRAPSPEDFGKLIGRSGATVRRWESNTLVPDDKDIARIAVAARLTSQQAAFLSAACTRMRAIPAPDKRAFKGYMSSVLASTPYPAIVVDSLFYVRAWNSQVDALARGNTRLFAQGVHTIAMMLRAGPETLFRPTEHLESLRAALLYFWMATAVHSHRPEYKSLVQQLAGEPYFRQLWPELALGNDPSGDAPITLERTILGAGARFNVYAWPVWFPPSYQVYEYQPGDEASRARLAELNERAPSRVYFASPLHWVDTDASARGPEIFGRLAPQATDGAAPGRLSKGAAVPS